MRPHLRAVIALGLFAMSAGGCAGVRYRVRADGSRYPVSLSPVLLDPAGRPVYLGQELHEIGRFHYDAVKVGAIYGAVGGTLDLSETINREVGARGGDGAVAVVIATAGCPSNYFFPLTLLPFYPGCHQVSVSGIVVQYVPAQGKVVGLADGRSP